MDHMPSCKTLPILLVDDEASFRRSLADMLRDDGHEVLDYEAPAYIPPLPELGDIAILITDYEMPGGDGLTLADDFHGHHPASRVVLVTAYLTGSLESRAAERPFLQVVQKPVDYDILHAVLHDTAAPASSG
jgi:DNA-binding NtrC family response regulator